MSPIDRSADWDRAAAVMINAARSVGGTMYFKNGNGECWFYER